MMFEILAIINFWLCIIDCALAIYTLSLPLYGLAILSAILFVFCDKQADKHTKR